MNEDRSVLVIDDSREIRDMVKTLLAKEGLFGHFYEAADGEEAMALLNARGDVDVALMDLFMPKVGGIDVIRWVRGTRRYHDLPILVMSVDGRRDLKALSFDHGATDYVVKPFDVEELVARVRLLLERKTLQEKLARKEEELAGLREQGQAAALNDELTNLYSRPYFFGNLTREMRRCVRHKVPMTLMLLDVDDIRQADKTFGKKACDEVIKEVAGIVGSSLRQCDVVGRYGGEEFISYLVHTGLEEAVVPAERIRSRVEDKAFAFDDGTYRTTVSIGIAGFPGVMPESYGDFVQKASEALNEAKSTGKNCVVANYC